ncbi:hypothetical protein [Cryptosporangium sp. NPDC051539]|uniref:hypothetical protein n=1 Tax=Cryptosporangium sp. NPDC051539 TaxID=3363962 RepID=UPI0037AF241E
MTAVIFMPVILDPAHPVRQDAISNSDALIETRGLPHVFVVPGGAGHGAVDALPAEQPAAAA